MHTISGTYPHVIPSHPPLPHYPLLSLLPSNCPQCVMLLSLSLYVLIVQHPPMSENMWCLVFCSCVSLLKMIVFSLFHVTAKDMNSSFFYGCIVFHGVMCHIFFTQSIIGGNLGWFHGFAVVNSAAINIHVHVSL